MRNLLFFMFAGWIIFSCKNSCSSQIETLPTIDIVAGLNGGGEKINLSEYASSIEYIPLDVNMKVYVGELSSFTFRKQENCYYYGSLDNGTCLVFAGNGDFIRSIGRKGKAGNEYYTILDMEIYPVNKDVVVYDRDKLVLYTDKGEYKHSIQLDHIRMDGNLHIRDFNIIGEYICLHVTDNLFDMPGVIFLDFHGEKILADQLPQNTVRRIEFETPDGNRYRKRIGINSYLFGDFLTVINPLADTLFAYTSSLKKVPRYVVDFGKYKLFSDRSNQARAITINPNIAFEGENLLIFTLLTNENKFDYYRPGLGYMLYDKKTMTSRIIPYNEELNLYGFHNDLDNGAPFQPQGVWKDQLFQIVNAHHFIQNSARYSSPEMKDLAGKLTENSNPVLVVVSLK